MIFLHHILSVCSLSAWPCCRSSILVFSWHVKVSPVKMEWTRMVPQAGKEWEGQRSACSDRISSKLCISWISADMSSSSKWPHLKRKLNVLWFGLWLDAGTETESQLESDNRTKMCRQRRVTKPILLLVLWCAHLTCMARQVFCCFFPRVTCSLGCTVLFCPNTPPQGFFWTPVVTNLCVRLPALPGCWRWMYMSKMIHYIILMEILG